LPQDRAQRRRQREARLLLRLHLYDPRYAVFDRVLDGHDVHALALDLVNAGVEGGGLARAGRARDQDDPFVVLEQALDRLGLIGVEPERAQRLARGARVEDSATD